MKTIKNQYFFMSSYILFSFLCSLISSSIYSQTTEDKIENNPTYIYIIKGTLTVNIENISNVKIVHQKQSNSIKEEKLVKKFKSKKRKQKERTNTIVKNKKHITPFFLLDKNQRSNYSISSFNRKNIIYNNVNYNQHTILLKKSKEIKHFFYYQRNAFEYNIHLIGYLYTNLHSIRPPPLF